MTLCLCFNVAIHSEFKGDTSYVVVTEADGPLEICCNFRNDGPVIQVGYR